MGVSTGAAAERGKDAPRLVRVIPRVVRVVPQPRLDRVRRPARRACPSASTRRRSAPRGSSASTRAPPRRRRWSVPIGRSRDVQPAHELRLVVALEDAARPRRSGVAAGPRELSSLSARWWAISRTVHSPSIGRASSSASREVRDARPRRRRRRRGSGRRSASRSSRVIGMRSSSGLSGRPARDRLDLDEAALGQRRHRDGRAGGRRVRHERGVHAR